VRRVAVVGTVGPKIDDSLATIDDSLNCLGTWRNTVVRGGRRRDVRDDDTPNKRRMRAGMASGHLSTDSVERELVMGETMASQVVVKVGAAGHVHLYSRPELTLS
jgi:hypothetical protein